MKNNGPKPTTNSLKVHYLAYFWSAGLHPDDCEGIVLEQLERASAMRCCAPAGGCAVLWSAILRYGFSTVLMGAVLGNDMSVCRCVYIYIYTNV